MKITYKKIIILISIFIVGAFVFSNHSYASSGALKMNDAPRKYFKVDPDKLADVKVTIKDNNGIDSVKLYSINKEWDPKTKKVISFSKSDTTNKKMHIYTLSNKELLKGKTNYFYIEITDGSKNKNIQKSGFKVYVKKDKNKKYYAIDDAPRVKEFKLSGNKMSFIVKDAGGTKSAKIKDLNNSKTSKTFNGLKAGDATVEIDISEYKQIDGQYKLQITANDKNNVSATRTISFEIVPTSVKLNESKLIMNIGESKELKATIKPNNATKNGITWISSDKSVAKVDNKGKVEAIAAGTATITAKTANNKVATCSVTVTKKEAEVEVTGIKLDKVKLPMKIGESKNLKATIEPNNATNKGITWTSSNKKVATIDKNGKVKAIAVGTATITAKTANGKVATCSVTVTGINNAPRKYFDPDPKKLADVKVTITDNNGISSVKLYGGESLDDANSKKHLIELKAPANKKEFTFALSHEKELNGKTKYFYIEIEDGSGNIQNSEFKVYVKTKGKNKYYAIDDAPRVKGFTFRGNKISFSVNDAGGSKYVKVQDLNDKNEKTIYTAKNFAKAKKVTIDIKDCQKTDNGMCKLRITTEDRGKVKAIRTISFKAPEE